MGIKNLNKFLRGKCPEVYEEVHLSKFAYKKVAIDISLYMFKYKTIFGDAWKFAFLNLVCCLRRNDIHCVFIYDTAAPPEKSEERERRKEVREKNGQRIFELEQALERAKDTGVIEQILLDLNLEDTKAKSLLRKESAPSLLRIEDHINRLKNQTVSISSADFNLSKELFEIIGVPYFQAPLEAETCCADLCKRGLVEAVVSEDTDVLVYGGSFLLTKINTTNDTCIQINYNRILESLELTAEQFTDFCIMCGTDYNKNIFKVGPEKAYRLIKEFGSIDKIEGYDISVLNHIRVREIFKDYQRLNTEIKYCEPPNFEKLNVFLFKNNIRMNVERIRKDFSLKEIIIVDDDS